MIRIYIQDKPLFLVDHVTPEIEEYRKRPDTLFLSELNPFTPDEMLKEMMKKTVCVGVFQFHDLKKLFDAVTSRFTLLKAAGGFVFTNDGERVLLIFRMGKWDLPKGKLDLGEELKDCAVREVMEETGVDQVEIIQPLQITYHTYYDRGKHILKESNWFLMKTPNATSLVPQTEEDIERCEWVPLQNLSSYTNNMYPSIIHVVAEGKKILRQKN